MSASLTRKEFLAGGLALLLCPTGCGGDDDGGHTGTGGAAGAGGGGGAAGGGGAPAGGGAGGSGGAPGGCAATVEALISNNHGHALTVPLADIQAGVEKTYDISGSAKHCHQVTLTAADFATLASGGVVTKTTCNGTNHELVLSCGTPPAPGNPTCDSTPTLGTCA